MLAKAYDAATVPVVALETLCMARADEEKRYVDECHQKQVYSCSIAHEVLRGVYKQQSGDENKWKQTLKTVIDGSPYCSWRLQLRDTNDTTLERWLQELGERNCNE